jgi:hypothetical protein
VGKKMKIAKRKFFLEHLLLLIGVLSLSRSVSAADYYVNDASFAEAGSLCSAVGDVWPTNDGTSTSSPLSTVAAVIANYTLAAGDVIYVDPGTYTTDVELLAGNTTDYGFTIQGVLVAGVPVSVFDYGAGNGHWMTVNRGATDDITIKNLYITGYKPTGATSYGGFINNNNSQGDTDNTGFSIIDCVIDDCDAISYGGAMYWSPTGESSISLTGCTFLNCDISAGGGGAIYTDSPILLTRCTFYTNTTSADGSAILIYTTSTANVITNCLFYDNTAGGVGAVFLGDQTQTVTLYNSTIADNTSYGLYKSQSSQTVTCYAYNCVMYGNSTSDAYKAGGALTLTYSCYGVSNATITTGSLAATDPLFVGGGDYHLTSTSPCINLGDPTGAPTDDIDVASRSGNPDAGCYEYIAPGYYWVGDAGDWSDYAAHWATSSGGATFHTAVPTASNHVYFDANSFTAGGQIVDVDVNAYCKNMTWTGATNSPTLHFPDPGFSQDLYIDGSLVFIAAMSVTNSNAAKFYYTSTTIGNTITSAGIGHQSSYFTGSGGEWTLLDDFDAVSTEDLFVQTGATLITGGNDINFGDLSVTGTGILTLGSDNALFSGSGTITGTVTISTGTLDVDGTFDATGGNLTFTGAGILNLGGATVTSLGTFTPSTGTVSYNRAGAQTVLAETYYNLTISGGGSAVKTAGGTVNVSNDLTVAASTTYAVATTTSTVTGTTDINGTMTISTGTFDANGTFDATGGTVQFTTNSSTAKLYLGSTVTDFGTFTLPGGYPNVYYDGTSAQNVFATTYPSLTVSGANTKTITGTTYMTDVGKLTVSAGTTLAVGDQSLLRSNVSGTAITHVINGTVTLNDGTWTSTFGASQSLDASGGAITVTGTGTIKAIGNGTHDFGAFTPGTGTVLYNRANVQNITATTYHHLTLSGSGFTKTMLGTTTITGDLTVSTGTTMSVNSRTINVTGATTVVGTVSISSGTLNVDGTFDATGAAVTFTGAGNLTLGGAVTDLGTLTLATGCTVTYDAAGDQNVDNVNYYNLTIDGSGTKTLTGNMDLGGANGEGVLTVDTGCTFAIGNHTITHTNLDDSVDGYVNTISGTVTLNNGSWTPTYGVESALTTTGSITVTGTGTIVLKGGVTPTLGTFTCGTGTVRYDRNGAQTVLAKNYYDLIFANANTKTLAGAIVVANDLTIDATVTADVSGSHYSINVGGDFTNNGTFTAQNGTVTFDGGAAQVIAGSVDPAFYALTVDNSSTGVSLGLNTSITNTLTFTTGVFTTQGYTLTIGVVGSSNGTISGAGAGKYLVAYDNGGTIGYLKRSVTSDATYDFPIGDASNYTPTSLVLNSNAGLASAHITAHTIAAKNDELSGGIGTFVARQWALTQSGITTPNFDFSADYATADITGTEADLLPVNWNGTSWVRPPNSSFTTGSTDGTTGSVTEGTNTLGWTGMTGFGTIGGAGNAAVPLPVELISFLGIKEGRNNRLLWSTASEWNNDFFTVEKTADGVLFESVLQVKGKGTTTEFSEYEVLDHTVEPTVNYYRLTQTDFDGKISRTELISIDNSITVPTLNQEITLKTNVLGQEVNEFYRGLVIILYSDGTSAKMIQ